LRRVFEGFGVSAAQIVHQCGSGVTACHNLLCHGNGWFVGLGAVPGLVSEWSSDPARPGGPRLMPP
jgi:thiosulfate/3-mercaptopyruvate sulfurtransferase